MNKSFFSSHKSIILSLMAGLALTSCTGTQQASEAPNDASATPAQEVELSEAQQAASVVIDYTEAIKAKDSATVCNTLDPQVINVAVSSLASMEEAAEKDCVATFDSLLAEVDESNTVIAETFELDTFAERAENVSEGVYAFPENLVIEGSSAKIFVKQIEGDWKISFDPDEAEAVQQIEEAAK